VKELIQALAEEYDSRTLPKGRQKKRVLQQARAGERSVREVREGGFEPPKAYAIGSEAEAALERFYPLDLVPASIKAGLGYPRSVSATSTTSS